MTQLEKLLTDIKSLEKKEQTELLSKFLSSLYDTSFILEYIETIVCSYYGISREIIHSRLRYQELVVPRQLIMYFARRFTTFSSGTIGAFCGKRDHATVLNACIRIEKLKEENLCLKNDIENISEMLNSTIKKGQTNNLLWEVVAPIPQ